AAEPGEQGHQDDMCGTEVVPTQRVVDTAGDGTTVEKMDAALESDGGRIAVCAPSVLLHSGVAPSGVFTRSLAGEHPSVSEPTGSFEHGLSATAHPNRNRLLHWERAAAEPVDRVPPTLERDRGRRPERTQECDLLLDTSPA